MKKLLLVSFAIAVSAMSLNACADETTSIKVWSNKEDHQDMQRQLGITKLRRGRDANQESPNKANYEEDKANIYGDFAGAS